MSMTLKEIADFVGAELVDCEDPLGSISMLMPIEAARKGAISFITGQKYASKLASSDATALICPPEMKSMPHNAALLLHESPRLAFTLLMQRWFHVEPQWDGVHASAIVDPTAQISSAVSLGANCVIGRQAKIGERVKIFPGVVLGDEAVIGDDSIIHANVTIYKGCKIGKKVILHSGVVIGGDGFGFEPNLKAGRHEKIPHLGHVVIEDEVEIGANSTVDRAVFGQTRIGRGTKIDNLVQIAHNVEIGQGCLIAAQCGLAGSVKIGNFVVLAGQVGVVGHVTIGDQVEVGGQSAVTRSVLAGTKILGSPAFEGSFAKRVYATLRRLPEIRKTVRRLQKRLEKSAP